MLRILSVASAELQYVNQRPMVVVEDEVIPLLSLADMGESDEFAPKEADKVIAVMLSDGRQSVAMIVDEIMGNEELVVQPLGEVLQDVDVVNGAAVLGDGRVCLIVDVGSVVRSVVQAERERTVGVA